MSVVTGREDRPVSGGDSAIGILPDWAYAEVAGIRGLNVVALARWAQRSSEEMAANIGEVLHHADWFITSDPEAVRLSQMHDCQECQDSMNRALAYMSMNPGAEMLVGQLFWAG